MVVTSLGALNEAVHRVLPRPLREFVKFGVVGTVGFTVDMGTFTAFYGLLRWDTIFTVFGYKIIAANLVSVFLAVIAVFLLNKFWTFRDPRAAVLAQQGGRFFTLYLATYVGNQFLTSLFAFRVHPLQLFFQQYTVYIAKILAIGVILFVNFFGSKFLVFRNTPERQLVR